MSSVQVVEVDVSDAHDDAALLGQHEPGDDVGVVVERGDDDLVARGERAPDGAA